MNIITKDMLIDALKDGMMPEDIVFLLDAAIEECEKEKQNETKRLALMDGMLAYVGKDHDLWLHIDPWDALENLECVLDKMISDNCVCDSCTEEKCSCAKDTLDEPKIVAKVITRDKNGVHEKDLSPEEIDNILGDWLTKMI